MAYNQAVATVVSDAFRSAVETRLLMSERLELEKLLQSVLNIKNIRNVQLWTRFQATQRNFINRNLGEYEMDLRMWIAEKFINNTAPTFPTKVRRFTTPMNTSDYQKFLQYATDNYIREYTTRIFFEASDLYIEYASDSDVNPDEIDLDSPEFDDIVEDET